MAKIRYSYRTQTARGDTCFNGIRSKCRAIELANMWSKQFPDCAPYSVTRRVAGPREPLSNYSEVTYAPA